MKIKIDIKLPDLSKLKKEVSDKIAAQEIELSCICGHKIRKSLRWLNDNKNLICPSCRATINLLDNKELGKVLKSLGK